MPPDVDLRVMKALDALLHEQSVTRAAERMHISPPAMSRTLSRIRKMLDDPVLVPAGRRMVLTPRALALRDRVHAIVHEAESLLCSEEYADTASAQRSFTVNVHDAYLDLVISKITPLALAQAPGLTLQFASNGYIVGQLAREGSADLAIGITPDSCHDIRSDILLAEQYVAIVGSGNLLAGHRIGLKQFADAGHVSVVRGDASSDPVDRVLAGLGMRRRIIASVPDDMSAAWVAHQTDLVATVPQSVARRTPVASGVKTIELPVATQRIEICMVWHPRHDIDHWHAWLRECVRGIFRDYLVPAAA